eukprot:6183437-Pleurochrysis_carterae.AAC.1
MPPALPAAPAPAAAAFTSPFGCTRPFWCAVAWLAAMVSSAFCALAHEYFDHGTARCTWP